MSTTPALADIFKFNLWANLRLLDACAGLDSGALDATVSGTFGSIRKTLLHVVGAEEGYVSRFTGQRPERPLRNGDDFPGFDELRRRALQSGEALVAIGEQFVPGRTFQIPYDGQIYDVAAILVLIQAITHATEHRSQVATILTQQGINPPEIDGWAYLESQEEKV